MRLLRNRKRKKVQNKAPAWTRIPLSLFSLDVVHDDSQNVGNEKGVFSLRWNNSRDLSADGGYLCGLVSWVF